VRVFGEEDPLLKVGVIMMALALALVIAAIVVSVALRSEPGRVGRSRGCRDEDPWRTATVLLRGGRECD
jgi:hypothetical protein